MAKKDQQKRSSERLEEQFRIGETPANQAISQGVPIDRTQTEVSLPFGEGLEATAKQTALSGPFADALNFGASLFLQSDGKDFGREKISAFEANQLYPYMSKPFSEPVDPVVASFLAERQKELADLQAVVDATSQGILAKGTRLGLQLAVGMHDPMNAVTGLGVGSAIGWGARRFGISAFTGEGILSRGSHGIAGNLVYEPINAAFRSALQEEYDPVESITYSALMGAALPIGMHFIARGVSRITSILNSAPKADALAFQSAVAKMNAGKAVDSARVVRDVMAERLPPPGMPNLPPIPGMPDLPGVPRSLTAFREQMREYRFVPLKSGRDYAKRPFYHASELMNDTMVSTRGHVLERNYGQGIYLTDSPVHANGYAASKYGLEGGGIFEVQINAEKANILDLSKGLPEKAKTIIEAHWEKWRPKELVRPVSDAPGKLRDTLSAPVDETAGMFKGKTGAEILDLIEERVNSGELPRRALDELNDAFKASGFDGLRFEGGSDLGGAPHNVVMLFDPEFSGNANGLVKELASFAPDEAMIPTARIEDVQEAVDHLKSIQSDALYSEEAYQHIDRSMKEPVIPVKAAEAKDRLAQVDLEFAEARKAGRMTPEMEAEFESISKIVEAGEVHDALTKAAFNCFRTGV